MSLEDMLGVGDSPDREAVTDGTTTLNRRDLMGAARHLAGRLRSTVEPTARVGVTSVGVQGLVDVLGCLLSNRSTALLPTDGLGSEQPLDVAQAAHCQALVSQGAIEVLSLVRDDVGRFTTDGLTPDDSPERLVLFTSGTTSLPKGVRLSEANLLAHLTAMLRTAVPWESGDRMGQTLTMSHSFGLSMALLALATRTPLVMLPDGAPGRRLAEAMDANGVTVYACVPYFLRLMATRGIDLGGNAARGLKHLYLAGGGVSDTDLAALLPNYAGETYLMYGLTEATARVAVRRGRDGAPSNSVGLPLPGIHVRIVGPEGEPLAVGETGRVQVFSPTLMIGYVGNEPRKPGDPITTTDLGHLDTAGNLYITGRQAEMMNFRGNRVSLPAVEALIDGIDGVRQSRLRPDSREEDTPAELLIVAEPGAEQKPIRMAVLRTVVPKGLVRQITFVDHLPTTRSGKAIRR
ncbi:class I adenylate-forming enzyme family protein [Micropruina glycogenica]|uniref:class I adenylate-forming enzyme family protein n=1 Tax=Micropruina glycogenica TaxID=75385 RepID=UPI000CF6D54D|nr:fatty acid--CoA ligase family protein [Micropruina glycogenica]